MKSGKVVCRVCVRVLDGVASKGLAKVTLETKPEGGEGGSHIAILGHSPLGRGHSERNGAKIGCPAPGRNHKARVAKTEQKGVQISKGLAGLSKEGGEPQRVLRRGRKRTPMAPMERWVECSRLRNLEPR